MPEETTEQNIRKISPKEGLLSWEAPEFTHHERDFKWYLIASFVILGFIGYSIYSKDWFFLVLLPFILAGIFVYLKSAPKIRTYTLTRSGIFIDDRFLSYDELHSFWVVFEEKVKMLYLVQNKKFAPATEIDIAEEDPVLLKSILKRFIPEQEKRGENYADKITRILRF